jgi:hypothetical protein
MSLKYLKRFQDRVATPRGIDTIVEKNILMKVKETGHFGEAQSSG